MRQFKPPTLPGPPASSRRVPSYPPCNFLKKPLVIASLSQHLQHLDGAVTPLRAAYRRLEREKMAIILAFKFSASRELPLQTELARKSSKLSDPHGKLFSAEQTIKDQGRKTSSKDKQLSSKDGEIRSLNE